MSNKPRRRLTNARVRGQEPDVGVVAGWCMPDALEECKQSTHDALLRLMGVRRTGGVIWHTFDGGAALAVIGQMCADALKDGDLTSGQYYAELSARLQVRGGVLVLATADSANPRSN